MMRVVFDTNTIVSAILWGNKPREALYAIGQKRAILLCSQALRNEILEVLSREKFAPKFEALGMSPQQVMDDFQAMIEWVENPPQLGRVVPNDPKDDLIIECAVGGKAEYIVSGDHHLLEMQNYASIQILSVQAFLSLLDADTPP
jgi:putative PIN family toxin of toxin-antitoxin system